MSDQRILRSVYGNPPLSGANAVPLGARRFNTPYRLSAETSPTDQELLRLTDASSRSPRQPRIATSHSSLDSLEIARQAASEASSSVNQRVSVTAKHLGPQIGIEDSELVVSDSHRRSRDEPSGSKTTISGEPATPINAIASSGHLSTPASPRRSSNLPRGLAPSGRTKRERECHYDLGPSKRMKTGDESISAVSVDPPAKDDSCMVMQLTGAGTRARPEETHLDNRSAFSRDLTSLSPLEAALGFPNATSEVAGSRTSKERTSLSMDVLRAKSDGRYQVPSNDGQVHSDSEAFHDHNAPIASQSNKAVVETPSAGHRVDPSAFQALTYLEDPRKQDSIVSHHGKRTLKVARDLTQMVLNRSPAGAHDSGDGWIVNATDSRATGASEVGLIAEFDMPVIRGDTRPPAESATRWVPGPNNMIIMVKRCVGLITLNDDNIKLIKPFTTKSGTDLAVLRRPGRLEHYIQVIRSPEEDNVRREIGVYGTLMFETHDVQSINWNITGPRLMQKDSNYAHPHGRPYRIVGHTKEAYDADLIVEMHQTAADTAIKQTQAAFRERRSNPDWFKQYRSLRRSTNDYSTAVDQVRSSSSNTKSRTRILIWSRHVPSRLQTAMHHSFRLVTSPRRPDVTRLAEPAGTPLRVSKDVTQCSDDQEGFISQSSDNLAGGKSIVDMRLKGHRYPRTCMIFHVLASAICHVKIRLTLSTTVALTARLFPEKASKASSIV